MSSQNLDSHRQFWFDPVQNFYARFERPISSISLVGGFVFDALTLKRVDMFWENFWVVIHLLVVAICIVLINRKGEEVDGRNPIGLHFWLLNIIQFFFGGLLSTYLVFYFRSGSILVSWPFILILVIAFAANERLKHHFSRLTFQISFLFLSLYTFSIFVVPVILHSIGTLEFLISGIVSVVILLLFLRIIKRYTKEKFIMHRKNLLYSIGGILLGMNLLYFANLIPPIPLSLKDAGIYHSLSKDSMGNYVVAYEDVGWSEYFSLYPKAHITSGSPLYAYSAVFSPTSLDTNVIHEWQKYNESSKKWITMSRVNLSVVGGRDDGYRTYSQKENIAEGKWRVNVKTVRGQVVGRIQFDVVLTQGEPSLVSKINL